MEGAAAPRGRWVGNVLVPPLHLGPLLAARGEGPPLPQLACPPPAATPTPATGRSAAEAVLRRLQEISGQAGQHSPDGVGSSSAGSSIASSTAAPPVPAPAPVGTPAAAAPSSPPPVPSLGRLSRLPQPGDPPGPSSRRPEDVEGTSPYCDYPSQIPWLPHSPRARSREEGGDEGPLHSHCLRLPQDAPLPTPPSAAPSRRSRPSAGTASPALARAGRPRTAPLPPQQPQTVVAASQARPYVAAQPRPATAAAATPPPSLTSAMPSKSGAAQVAPPDARRSTGAVQAWVSAVRITPVAAAAPAEAESSNVRVVVRMRPRAGAELKGPEAFDFDASQRFVSVKERTFQFDAALGSKARQKDVYEQHCKPLVEAFLEGQNATVLAYGQTGSGKTYTMGTGGNTNSGQDGCLMRTLQDVFGAMDRWRAAQREVTYEVSCQFLEIYNEEIRDLLHPTTPSHNIRIRETPGGGIAVTGLREVAARGFPEILSLFYTGCEARATGTTNVNKRSSRSHAIFTLHLKQLAQGAVVRRSKMHIVDLAGSERNKKTGTVGLRFKEAISINKGLLALGNVISALSDQSGRAQHVPYRDSKITRILQDSLGGDHRTCMIACISPSTLTLDESLNTLKYASRARNITNVTRPPAPDQDTVMQYLVDFCEGVTAESAGVPEDIVAAMQPAAVLAAMARVRHSQCELRAQLAGLADASGGTQHQVEELRVKNMVLMSECSKARAEAAAAQRAADMHADAAALARLESAQRRVKSERAQHASRRALGAIQAVLKESSVGGVVAMELRELAAELSGAAMSPISSKASECGSETDDWRSHPISAVATGGSVTPITPLRGLSYRPPEEAPPPPAVAESIGGSAESVQDSASDSMRARCSDVEITFDHRTAPEARPSGLGWRAHPEPKKLKRGGTQEADAGFPRLERRRTAAELAAPGDAQDGKTRLRSWLRRLWS